MNKGRIEEQVLKMKFIYASAKSMTIPEQVNSKLFDCPYKAIDHYIGFKPDRLRRDIIQII